MDKFIQYDYNEFARETSFVNWVKNSNAQDTAFWNAWIKEHPEKKEAVEKAKLFVEQLVFKEAPVSKIREDKVWAKIAAETQEDKFVEPRKIEPRKIEAEKAEGGSIVRRLFLFAAAAAALFAVFFLFRGNDLGVIYSTEMAKMETVKLPDGSVVTLNADSEISFDDKNWQAERKIDLKGEAFFDVMKGAKFSVVTSLGTVEVLGTSFNVFAREKELAVFCATGKVAVNANSQETILTPNEKVLVVNGKHAKQSNVDGNQNRSTWRENIYHYDGVEFSKVIDDVKRQYNVEISLPNELKHKAFSGNFSGANAQEALSNVCYVMGLEAKWNGNNAVIDYVTN